MIYTEATLKGLNKPNLIKLVFRLESEMDSNIKELTLEIRDLVAQMEKIEDDVAIVKNVNEKLVNQLMETEQQCWANGQYSMRECLEVVGMPDSIHNDSFEGKRHEDKDIQTCHRLKDNDRVISKFSNSKDTFRFFVSRKTLNLWTRLNESFLRARESI